MGNVVDYFYCIGCIVCVGVIGCVINICLFGSVDFVRVVRDVEANGDFVESVFS